MSAPAVAVIHLGNESVIESWKPDEGTNETRLRSRSELGRQVTTMHLSETTPVRNYETGELGPDEEPSRAMNLALVQRFWGQHSNKPPAWVEGTDPLLVELVSDSLGCRIGRPKNWHNGPRVDDSGSQADKKD